MLLYSKTLDSGCNHEVLGMLEAKNLSKIGILTRFIYLLGLFLTTLHQPSKLKSLESELIQPKRETTVFLIL